MRKHMRDFTSPSPDELIGKGIGGLSGVSGARMKAEGLRDCVIRHPVNEQSDHTVWLQPRRRRGFWLTEENLVKRVERRLSKGKEAGASLFVLCWLARQDICLHRRGPAVAAVERWNDEIDAGRLWNSMDVRHLHVPPVRAAMP